MKPTNVSRKKMRKREGQGGGGGGAPAELTKKQELNNHIVLMRKVIKRTRVQLINRMTKEVKKLKERKGEGKEKEKAKRKAERYLQEIQVIKHLKEDKISIHALLQPPSVKMEEVLMNPKLSLEQRALARFSHHKLVISEVEKYRGKNPNWDVQIPVLLEKGQDKRKRIDKELKEKEVGGWDRKVIVKERGGGEDKDNQDHYSSADDQEEKEYPDPEPSSSGDELEPEDCVLGIREEAVENDEDETPSKKQNNISKKFLSLPAKKPPSSAPIISKNQGTVKVQVLKDLADLEKSEERLAVTEDEAEVAEVNLIRPKSSFFLGGVDEVKEEEDNNFNKNVNNNFRRRPDQGEFKPIFKKGKMINKPPRGGGGGFKGPPQPKRSSRYFDKGSGNDSNPNLLPVTAAPRKDDNRHLSIIATHRDNHRDNHHNVQPSTGGTDNPAPEKLHPSWEAKKRQAISLSEFKGKKIKFDDD